MNANGHEANIELMKRMGAKRGYDPIPPDQYLYFLNGDDPEQVLLAWVRSKTLRLGHRSPWCVDERGRVLTKADAARELRWDRGFLSRIWKRLKKKGLVAEDNDGRLLLCGDVPARDGGSAKAKTVDCTVNSPAYLKAQIQQLSEDERAEFLRDYARLRDFRNRAAADAIAQIRSLTESMEAELFAKFALKKKSGKKRREATSTVVHVTLVDAGGFVVQANGLAVEATMGELYIATNGAEQSAPSLLSSEGSENKDCGPPAAASFVPIALRAVGYAAGAGEEFAQHILENARRARADVMPEELGDILAPLWAAVSCNKRIDNPLGLCIRKIAGEVTAKLDTLRAQQEQQRIQQAKAAEQMKRMWIEILNNPEESEEMHEIARATLSEYESSDT